MLSWIVSHTFTQKNFFFVHLTGLDTTEHTLEVDLRRDTVDDVKDRAAKLCNVAFEDLRITRNPSETDEPARNDAWNPDPTL